MSKFIELNVIALGRKDAKPYQELFNLSYVSSVTECCFVGAGSTIYYKGTSVTVIEDYETVKQMILDAGK